MRREGLTVLQDEAGLSQTTKGEISSLPPERVHLGRRDLPERNGPARAKR
jgi:hypothetical protein